MAVAYKNLIGSAGSTTSSTTLVITTLAAIAVGDLVVVWASADNLNATTPTFTCADSGGNTYTTHRNQAVNATGAAGVAGAIMATKATNAVSSGGTITITMSGAVASKSAYAEAFTGADNTLRFTAQSASGSGTAAASPASSAPTVGDLVIGCIGAETRATATGDADTTGGAWSIFQSIPSSASGSDAARTQVNGQYKIATSTAAQTYNNTIGASTDWVALIAVFQATQTPAITQAAYRFYDQGTESGSTALQPQDTAHTGDLTAGDGLGHLRIRLQSTTAVAVAATDDFQLQYEKNTSGTWVNVASAYKRIDAQGTGSSTSSFGASGGNNGFGQSFTGDGTALRRAMFRLKRTGTPAQNITAQVFAHTGTFGSNGTPTGTALATSTAINASTLSTTAATVYFDFDGSFTPVNGTNYFIVVDVPNGPDAFSVDQYYQSGFTTYHPGNRAIRSSAGTWSSSSSDMLFGVYSLVTPSSTVTGYDDPSLIDTDATTNRLGAGTGTFVAGKVSKTGVADNVGWTANNYTELLYSLQFVKAQLAHNDVIRFRVLRNGVTTEMTYTVTPQVTLTIPAVAYPITATGTGTSDGALALGALCPIAASGTGTSDGTLTVVVPPRVYDLAATGDTVTAGSIAVEIPTFLPTGARALEVGTARNDEGGVPRLLESAVAPTAYSIVGTGTGTSAGALAVAVSSPISATGTGTSTGALDVAVAPRTYALTAIGTGTSTGTLAVTVAPRTYALTATGAGTSIGSLALTSTLVAAATGTGASTGTLAVTITGPAAVEYPISATGTGASTGALNLQTTRPLSATGTGASTGTLAVTVAPRTYALAATGTGTSTGSLAVAFVPRTYSLAATGTGTSVGTLAVTITGPTAVDYPISATGTGASTGALNVQTSRPLAASGTGTSTGALAVTIPARTYELTATGTGTSTGSLNIVRATPITATGASASAGALAVSSRLAATATSASVSTGALDVVVAVRHPISATGTGQTTGNATVFVQGDRSLSALGFSQATGSVAVGGILVASASGTGTSTGAVAVTVAPRTYSLDATGTGTSDGALSARIIGLVSATGTGTTTGAVIFAHRASFTASGLAVTTGTVTLTSLLKIAATGSGSTVGLLDIDFAPTEVVGYWGILAL